MKKTWNVTATVVGGTYIGEYKAETGSEAIEMARNHAGVSFCHQCSRGCENAEVDRLVAECGSEVVEEDPEMSWEQRALAAGWTPPTTAGKAKKRAAPQSEEKAPPPVAPDKLTATQWELLTNIANAGPLGFSVAGTRGATARVLREQAPPLIAHVPGWPGRQRITAAGLKRHAQGFDPAPRSPRFTGARGR